MTDRRTLNRVGEALRQKFVDVNSIPTWGSLADTAINAYHAAQNEFGTSDFPTRFTVKGRGIFPADMLRHDHCWPVDGNINAVTEPRLEYPLAEVTVTLCAQSRRCITPARWQSCGWIVTDIDGERA